MAKLRPRTGPKPTSSSGAKAPRLPRSGKKKPKSHVDAAGGEPSGDGPSRSRKREKRQKRSVLGFLVGATACLALWGWTVAQGIAKRKRDRRILKTMARRPLGTFFV